MAKILLLVFCIGMLVLTLVPKKGIPRRKIDVLYIVIFAAYALMISANITGTAINHKKTQGFSEEFQEKASQIPWDDAAYLERLGFESSSDTDALYYYDTTPSNGYFEITIKPMDQETAIRNYALSVCTGDDSIYVGEDIIVGYKNDFHELIGLPNRVVASYHLYYNGYFVLMRNSNKTADGQNWLEQYIVDL